MAKKTAEPKFEDALAELEQIVEELEGDELSLDNAIAKYEQGVKLSRLCQKQLEAAQQKIVKVQEAAGGGLEEEPLEEGPDSGSLFDTAVAADEEEEIPF